MVVTTKPPENLSSADRFMLRFLRLPLEREGTSAEAQSAFQKSILISSIRCTLTYVFFPFIAPTIGFFANFSSVVGIIVSMIAIMSISFSMRRFWGSRHPHRWTYTVLGGLMFCFLLYLLVRDLSGLL